MLEYENVRKLELMHKYIRKYDTVYNTVTPGTELAGTPRRAKAQT